MNDTSNSIRTSSLSSPTLKLTGHSGSVYALEYSADGSTLCSAGFDMKALLWSHSDQYENYNVLEGHKNAILDLTFTHDNESIVTASADKTCMVWDAPSGQRVRKLTEHSDIVNAIDSAPTGKVTVMGMGC